MQVFNGIHSDGQAFLGCWQGGEAYDLSAAAEAANHPHRHALRSTDSMLAALGVDWAKKISGLELRGAIQGFTFATPIRRPGKIIALVRNYRAHAEELGNAPPPKMRWFAKLPSTMLAHGETMEIPKWVEGRVDHEVELGVVIGREARHVSRDDALDYVGGYTILNDVSARTLQQELKNESMPWIPAKNLQGFCPTGALLTSPDAIADPQNLSVRCSVNGQLRQSGNTSEMMHSVAKIIHELSDWLTLEAGDILATGTPAGVGPLEDGDLVECEIESVGFLQHSVARGR